MRAYAVDVLGMHLNAHGCVLCLTLFIASHNTYALELTVSSRIWLVFGVFQTLWSVSVHAALARTAQQAGVCPSCA